MTCPSCGGAKSKTARLCASCRRRASALGERALLEPPRGVPARPRTAQQNTAYHAKLGELARMTGQHLLDMKRDALELASAMFNRDVTSSTQLTEIEMEQLLDRIDVRMLELRAAAAPA